MLQHIDIGCDVGEGFGVYKYGYDEEVMEYITSANIACCFHAGDPVVMHKTLQMAAAKKVAVGAHPGLPDLLGFGRRFMNVSAPDLCDYITYQVGALEAFCKINGVRLEHVKFHGALARMSATDKGLATMLVERIKRYNSGLILVAFAGSALEEAALELGLPVAAEVLIDRGYGGEGNLIPVSKPGGIVREPGRILEQVEEVVVNSRIKTVQGSYVNLNRVHTLGFHFGTTGIDLVREIRSRLENLGVRVLPVGGFIGK